MDIKFVSILAAALAVSIGSIGPALAEGRSVAAAMDAIARQPEAAGTISRTLFVGLAMIETMAIYCLVDRAAAAVCQSLCRVTMHFDWSTFALQTVNFAILVWLLHRFLYRPVLRLVDARRAEIDQQFAAARVAETKAEDQLAAITAERAGIAAERAAALKAAAAQAEEAAAARRAQSEREAAALLNAARTALAAERTEVSARQGRLRSTSAQTSPRGCSPKCQ